MTNLSKKQATIVLIVGVTGVVVLESVALLLGRDGVFFASSIGAVTLLVGWAIGRRGKAPHG